VDDIADDPARSVEAKRVELGRWREAVSSGLDPALEDILDRHAISRMYLREILDGCLTDVEPGWFASIDDLRRYCWRVACAVGLASIRIFGCRSSTSERYAEHLGYALQLTNILRDVREDAAMGRVYLPCDALARHGLRPESLLVADAEPGALNEMLRPVLAGLGELAAGEFRSARGLVSGEDFRQLAAAEVMREIYSRLLGRMAADGFRVWERRYHLPKPTKLRLLVVGLVRARWGRAPSSATSP
jgi:phytoene synthase